MMRISRLFLMAACLLPGVVLAQGNIVSDDATFRRTGTPFDTTPTADFVGVSATLAQDHLFETGWFFRVSGDTQESFFPVPTTQSYVGNASTNSWADVGARGLFSAVETSRVVDADGPAGPAPGGSVEMTMVLTNISAAPLDIDMFHAIDIDLEASVGNDVAVLQLMSPDLTLRITDVGASVAQYQGVGANATLVRPFGATDVFTVLQNTVVDNFDNTTLPFGPGDFTGAMQWTTVTIAPGATASYTARFTVNSNVFQAELALSKTDAVDPVIPLGVIDYTLTVDNTGGSAAPNTVVTDTLPAGVTLVATSGCAEDPAGVPTCTLGTVAAGTSASYGIQVTADVGTLGTITNNASVTSDASETNLVDNDASEDTTIVLQQADLTLTKTNDVGGVTTVDASFTWTLTLENANGTLAAAFAANDTILFDELPDTDIVYGSAMVTIAGGVTGTVDCTVTGSDLVCTATTAVSVPIGGSITVDVPAGPMAVATFDNPRAAGVCTADPGNVVVESNEANNACADSVQAQQIGIFADGFEDP